MRVCLISREYPPDTGWGGIATFTQHLAHGLKDLGHQVEVVSLATGEAKIDASSGITVHRVPEYDLPGKLGTVSMCMPYSRYVLRTSTALWEKFFALHQEKPFDVVDTPELLAEGLYPAVTSVVPLVIRLYTPHSKFIAEGLHNVTPSFDHQFVAMLERLAMLNADAITSPSEDLADFVSRDLNYSREKISIIRNPIDPEKFTPDGTTALEKTGKKIVLFVGRLEERKGIRYLIEAIPRVRQAVPDVQFVIIGDDTNNAKGQKSTLAELKAILNTHRVADAVTFIPRVPLHELPAYYRSADICVVPSVYDNSPYTCLEAMSCGRPVIGTTAGGTGEYIGNRESGVLVPPKDADALAAEITALLKDDSRRLQIGESARRRVLDKFQRKEIARQTAGLYMLARENFQAREKPSLYLKPTDEALPDAEAFLYSYDKMLYDLLYQESYRFRIRHWWRLATKRPRLFSAKLFHRFANLILAASPIRPEKATRFLDALSRDIEIKQDLNIPKKLHNLPTPGELVEHNN
jgi:glycogen synthase